MPARTKYTVFGALFGALFPVVGTLVHAWNHVESISLEALLQVQAGSPLLWIIDTAPLWLGLFALGVGQREDALRRVIREREDTIASRTEDLEEALESATSANRAKGRFLANMSHEIRTPMTAILGYAEELLDLELRAEEREEAVRIIHGNGHHLLQVINDILDLSKIEAGKMTIERIPCSPRAMVHEVVSLMDIHARRKGLEFHAECVGPLPETVLSDPTRTRQILLNLLGNAIKFTEEGSVRLEVKLVEDRGEPQIEFRVCDTGIGISPEQMERLFGSFSQADDSTSRKYGGTGLGLAVCKRLVELMSGSCRLESTRGVGSCFSVTLPTGDLTGVAMSEGLTEGCGASAGVSNAAPAATALAGFSVLLAEDNPVNARLIRSILERHGAEVVVVENGRAALEASLARSSNGDPFAVVLMDIQMPKMDGYESTRRLRAAGYDRPILALTANAMPADQQLCLAAGCDDCTTKPIDRADLLARIQRLLPEGAPSKAPAGL